LYGCSSTTDTNPQKLQKINLEELKDSIEIGISKDEITELLSGPHKVIEENSLDDMPDNSEMWIYDFTKDDYEYSREDPEAPDLKGLHSGSMRIQLLLQWTSGLFSQELSRYIIYYEENDSIYRILKIKGEQENLSIYDKEEDKFKEINK
ncbi:hypothetical protein ACTWQB_17335, partial [Piscibacillus sp. B03]|uniref:hypothetical protein n=1 Tax=Piscibacillus sp. B03 TaxID=3457430 RepID=UPI003FCE00F5